MGNNLYFAEEKLEAMSDDNQFEVTDAGASNTELVEAGRRKPGSLIIMKEQWPCKVTQFSTAKPGKHGSAKAMITAKDIFTDKQYEETFGTGDMIPAPIVEKQELNAMSYDDDDMLCMLMPDGDLKEDCRIPTESHLSDIAKRIKEIIDAGAKECLVTVQKWGDREQVVACREGQDA